MRKYYLGKRIEIFNWNLHWNISENQDREFLVWGIKWIDVRHHNKYNKISISGCEVHINV